MDEQESDLEAIEHVLNDKSADPVMLSYAFLKRVTNNFAEVIGSGGFGIVYMGVVRNWKLAVKMLHRNYDLSDKQFEKELQCLVRVKHKNIVRFLGYCSETQRKLLQHNDRFVLAEIRQRFLCFEYIPNKNLGYYLKDESHKLEWDTRYQIMQGICHGLRYLHNEERINHMDLKPDNILLDGDMVPKITDFGLSRHFSEECSRIVTQNIAGTPGYTAPEHWNNGEISFKSDIFSLGVIMKQLMMGSNDLSDFDRWHQLLDNDKYDAQLKRCITIAQLCVDDDQGKRPTIDCIIDMFNKMETVIEMVPGSSGHSSTSTLVQVSSDSSHLPGIDTARKVESSSEIHTPGPDENSKLLNVNPVVLHFPFELRKLITCPVSLTNRTRHRVGAWIKPSTSYSRFGSIFQCSSLFGIVEPNSAWTVDITLRKQYERPQLPRKEIDMFEVLMIAMRPELEPLLKSPIGPMLNMNTDFLQRVSRADMHRVMLTIVIDDSTSSQEVANDQISSSGSPDFVTAKLLDVHPLELRFPFEPNKCIQRPLTLANRSERHVGFLVTPMCLNDTRSVLGFQHSTTGCSEDKWPSILFSRLGPHSSTVVYVTMRKHESPPPLQGVTGQFKVIMIPTESKEDLKRLDSDLTSRIEMNQSHRLMLIVKKYTTEVHRAKLRVVVTCDAARCHEVTHHQLIPGNREEFGRIQCVDVHPTEPWVLMGHEESYASIWNYETQERVMLLKLTNLRNNPSIQSIKFVPGEQWIAAGDKSGFIHVHTHATKDKVDEFEAHPGKCVDLLDVHPNGPLLLTASSNAKLIKLWHRGLVGWTCARIFNTNDTVWNLTVGQRDTNTFASSSLCEVKVWDIHNSRDPIITLERSDKPTFYTDSHRQFLFTIGPGISHYDADIWDLHTKKHVHTLRLESNSDNYKLACHPKLPILATITATNKYKEKRHIFLWDVRNFRLLRMVEFSMDGYLICMVFDGNDDLTSLIAISTQGISIVKINVPMLSTGVQTN